MNNKTLFCFLTTVLLCTVASAQVAFECEGLFKDYTQASPMAFKSRLKVSGANVQAGTRSFTGQNTETIYRGDAGRIWQVRHDQKDFVEVDERLAVGLSQGVSQAADFLDRMKGKIMSEEPEAPPVPLSSRPTGEQRTVLGVPAALHHVMQGNTKVQEVWVADWKDLKIGGPDFAGLRKLLATYEKIAGALQSNPVTAGLPVLPMNAVARIDGYPLCIRHFENGRLSYEVILSPPEPSQIPPSVFNLPAGYEKSLL